MDLKIYILGWGENMGLKINHLLRFVLDLMDYHSGCTLMLTLLWIWLSVECSTAMLLHAQCLSYFSAAVLRHHGQGNL